MTEDGTKSDPMAVRILQAHHDKMANALLTGDFEMFAGGLTIPHFVRTQDAAFEVTNVDDMRRKFEEIRDHNAAGGVSRIIRIAVEAEFTDPDTIEGVHVTHLLRNDKHTGQPYANRTRLVRCADGAWRETRSSGGIKLVAGHFALTKPSSRDNADIPPLT